MSACFNMRMTLGVLLLLGCAVPMTVQGSPQRDASWARIEEYLAMRFSATREKPLVVVCVRGLSMAAGKKIADGYVDSLGVSAECPEAPKFVRKNGSPRPMVVIFSLLAVGQKATLVASAATSSEDSRRETAQFVGTTMVSLTLDGFQRSIPSSATDFRPQQR